MGKTELKPGDRYPAGEAVIVRGVGGKYRLHLGDGNYLTAVPRGLLRKKQQRPLPGDRVVYSMQEDPDQPAVIESVFSRKNSLVRPPLANVDRLILTLSVTAPDPDLLLLDKLLVIAAVAGVEPLVCFTKADLDPARAEHLSTCYKASGYQVVTGAPGAYDNLVQAISTVQHPGRILALAGPSGVGKSTLFNALSGRDLMLTGRVSRRTGRGRHTTRHVELLPTATGYLTDTPGFSSLDLGELGILPEEVILGFREFQTVAGRCRFNTCRHMAEPGCMVNDFVADRASRSEALYNHFQERLAHYRLLYEGVEAIAPHIRRQRRT